MEAEYYCYHHTCRLTRNFKLTAAKVVQNTSSRSATDSDYQEGQLNELTCSMPSKEGLLLEKEAHSHSNDRNRRSQTLSGSLTSKTDVRFRKSLSRDTVEGT